jgi:DNA-binding NtrC family response regulator
LLVAHLLAQIAERQAVPPARITEEAMAVLKAYRWPGNVRELQNALERAFALCNGGVIELRDLPERVLESVGKPGAPAAIQATGATMNEAVAEKAAGAAQWTGSSTPMSLKDFVRRQEIAYIEQAIQAAGGDKDKAAALLGVSIATLYRKLSPGTEETAAP